MKFNFLLVAFKGKRHAYSNLGYTVLGQVIVRKSGRAYEEFMTGLVKSLGINQMKIGRTRKKDLGDEEVRADVLRSYPFLGLMESHPPPLHYSLSAAKASLLFNPHPPMFLNFKMALAFSKFPRFPKIRLPRNL